MSSDRHRGTAGGGCHRWLTSAASTIVISSIILLSASSTTTISASNQAHSNQHQSAAAQLLTDSGSTSSNQRESLKRSLNEILVQFLHETGRQGQPSSNNHNQQQQQRSQQQQQRASSKEISCDELSLVVLAQRVLKMNASTSAISRLIECQHLETSSNHLLAKQQDNQLLDNNTNYNNNKLTNSKHGDGRPFTNCTPVISEMMEPQFISVHSSQKLAPTELHFGAKLALTILTATIFLVFFATLVDIQTSESSRDAKKLKSKCKPSLPSGSTVKYQANELRQHRSPSLSSSCSSSLFCSSNSVASSSAPILSNSNQHNGNHHHNTKRHHYELNIQQQMSFCNDNNLKPIGEYVTNANLHLNINNHQLSDSGVDLKINDHQHGPTGNNSYCWPAIDPSEHENDSEESQHQPSPLSHRDKHKSELGDHNTSQMIRQIFLAFSLRQSVKQIMGIDEKTTTALKRRREASESKDSLDQQNATGNQECAQNSSGAQLCSRSEVPSARAAAAQSQNQVRTVQQQAKMAALSAANSAASVRMPVGGENQESRHKSSPLCQHHCGNNYHPIRCHRCREPESHSTINITQQLESSTAQHESINSLHGLRFLSMIWVIVIHSYNFALRWMFFTNTTTVDGIYKTVASQLLANGSFACDSFFFAAGFLLPYLALAPSKPIKNTSTNHQLTSNTRGGENLDVENDRSEKSAQPNGKCPVGGENGSDKSKDGNTKSTCPAFEFTSCSPEETLEDGLGLHDACYLCRSTPETATNKSPHDCCLDCCCCAKNTNEQQGHQPRQQQGNNIRNQTTNRIKEAEHDTLTIAGEKHQHRRAAAKISLSFNQVLLNMFHRYVRMMPLMMAIIGLSSTLLRYIGDGPTWDDSTMMYDKWCRKNWWVNLLFLHNFVNRENMCLSHSWYSAVDLQLFLVGQLTMYILFKSRKIGMALLFLFLFGSQLITAVLTLVHHLPAVPIIPSVSEQAMNLYYAEIYIKPYCRASPYLIGILLAYLMRTTSLGQLRLKKWQVALGWTVSLSLFATILFIMQPAMNGHTPSELQSAAYSALSRPLWACATGWMIFACITKQGGPIGSLLSARCFVPFSRLTYPAFLIHPIVMAIFYGSRESSFHFSHYLMLYLILGNIVITYASAFILAALFELPLLSIERIVKRRISEKRRD